MPTPRVTVVFSVPMSRTGAPFQALRQVLPTEPECAVPERPAVEALAGSPWATGTLMEAHVACLVQQRLAIQRQKLLVEIKSWERDFPSWNLIGKPGQP